jgi:hypothetical protein
MMLLGVGTDMETDLVDLVLNIMKSKCDGGLADTHDMPNEDRSGRPIEHVQRMPDGKSLYRQEFPPKASNLDDILGLVFGSIMMEELADFDPGLPGKMHTSSTIEPMRESRAED